MPNKDKNLFSTEHLGADLKQRSLRSGAVTLSSQGIMFVIQLGSTMILARILSPEDYGMMAMVVAVTGLAGILSNLGLSTATIQRAEVTHEQVSTLFWTNAGVGALVTIVVAALAPLVAWFYKTPELLWVMLILSSNFLINGLAVQHQALLNRQMNFYAIAKIQVASMLTGIAVAIFAAIYGLGYWSLVLNSITAAVMNVIGAWLAVRWKPSLPKRNTGVKSMVKFGSDIVGFNVINYFARNLDNILIGRFYGGASLGLYSKAYQLLMMPITNLRDPMMKVAMPALSRLQNEPDEYREYYSRFISILAFISMPLIMFMFVCSDQLINLLLGTKWFGASTIFKVLAIAAFIQPVISSTLGVVLLSMGRGRRYLTLGAVNAAIISASFVIGLPWGAKGVACAYASAIYIIAFPSLVFVFRDTPLSINDFINSVSKPFLASSTMGLVCYFIANNMQKYNDLYVIVSCFLIGLPLFLLAIIVVPGGRQDLYDCFSYCRLIIKKN